MVTAMWYAWIVFMLLSVPIRFAAADVEPPHPVESVNAKPDSTEPNFQEVSDNVQESPGRRGKANEKYNGVNEEQHGTDSSSRAPPRTLDRGAAEQAWRAWLQSAESKDPAAPPRRITTKSLFVTPYMCPKGQRLAREGCVQLVTVNRDDHEKYILEQLNAVFAPPAGAPGDTGAGAPDMVYDYDEPVVDAAAGPLQLTIPLGLDPPSPLAAAASQIQPSEVHINVNKKDEIQKIELQDAKLEAELERLKVELDRLTNTNDLRRPNKETDHPDQSGPPHINFSNYPTMTVDKPKRDNSKENMTAMDNEQGHKEVVFGNVSEDTVLYANVKQTEDININDQKISPDPIKISAQISNVILSTLNETTNSTTNTIADDKSQIALVKPFDQTVRTDDSKIMTTTQSTHNLKENEKPTKLHPEIDYSDIGEAVKIISRYAEVTTDDMFKNEQKKYVDNNENPLGTRTKLQHRRKQWPSEPVPPPQPVTNINQFYPVHESIYDDRVPSHIIYPKTNLNQNGKLEYYQYPLQNQHFVPPPNYPFRHVQDYWTRPEQYLGPYAHANPRRHHHSYTGRALPARHARRPDTAYPTSPAPSRDLYSLLGLRHWFSSDGAAKR